MTKLPQKLLVAGGGPIGSELSQCFARFGSEVTLLDMAPSILTREDPDMREFVQKSFEKDDIHMLFKVKIKKVEHGEYIHKVTYEKDGKDEEVVGNALFVSVGRRPNIENLKLENAQIQTSRTGIIINQYCQTSASHIYACGDVAGGYQFTHFADYQARLVLRNALFPGKAKADYRVVPWCTYTDPELARVGISEQEAQQKNISHDIFRYDLSQLDRAVCDSEGRGLVKVVTKKGKDKILGASIVGFHAGDLLQEYVFAMKQNLGLKHISSTIHPYPTMAEATRRASDEWMRSRLKPWIVKLFTWYFGMLF
ncbi:MAG: FAD-dependent oxidoreductase [Deltaproteobacteria bacterium]|nr:FAD-dependent oxidoreductase [Deltaproteobacteria bacterium]